jgi:glycerol-3-phosphate cytidylyltransferase-like family protein
VLPDAPWVVDQAWLDKHQIDYIAHDELVYPSKDLEDVYAFAKRTGERRATWRDAPRHPLQFFLMPLPTMTHSQSLLLPFIDQTYDRCS